MYWKITVTHPPRGKSGSGITEVFIGPFKSKKEREAFRTYWEGEDILREGEKIEFIPANKLPEGRGALLPNDFHGIERWEIVE